MKLSRVLLCGLITLASGGAAAAGSPGEAWEEVLARYVDEEGLVDFQALSRDREPLAAYVEWVAATAPWTSPELFPTPRHEIAFYVNSYNALSMLGILEEGVPEKLGLFRRHSFFKGTEYTVGGRRMSLHEYENDVIRGMGEPRVHFVLNCMSASCPRLRREPMRGDRLEGQLQAAAEEFFNDPRHVRVDRQEREVAFNEILKWFREDFVNPRVAPGLIAYANRYRAEGIPASFDIEFMDYDWTVISAD